MRLIAAATCIDLFAKFSLRVYPDNQSTTTIAVRRIEQSPCHTEGIAEGRPGEANSRPDSLVRLLKQARMRSTRRNNRCELDSQSDSQDDRCKIRCSALTSIAASNGIYLPATAEFFRLGPSIEMRAGGRVEVMPQRATPNGRAGSNFADSSNRKQPEFDCKNSKRSTAK